MTYYKQFGERLNIALGSSDLKQNVLAKKLGKNASTVSHWVNGSSLPSTKMLLSICRILGASSDWLLGLDQEPFKQFEQTYDGISWIENIPAYIPEELQEEIRIGIQLFRTMLQEGYTMRQCVRKKLFGAKYFNWELLSRTFKVAVQANALRITRVERDHEKEKQLLQAFGERLLEVRVVQIPPLHGPTLRSEILSFVAATEVLSITNIRQPIGIGPGYSMFRLAEQSIPSFNHAATEWIPLMAEKNIKKGYENHSANHNVAILANRYPGSRSLILPYINPHKSPRELDLYDQSALQAIMDDVFQMAAMFCSVGGIARKKPEASPIYLALYNALKDEGLEEKVVSEQLGHFLDIDGNLIESDRINQVAAKNFITIDFKTLQEFAQNSQIWVIASGDYKQESVLASVRSGIANCLVIDTEIADYLLTQA